MKFLLILLLRMTSALISISWHVPDELWQSSEVAQRMVFGYGYRTWEWRDNAQIRSYLHAGIFVPWFSFLKKLHISDPFLYILGPRMIQGLLSALGDFYLLKALELILKKRSAKEGFYWLYFGNCFMNFCASRPLINAFECSISNIALYFYFRKNTFPLAALLSVGCVVRPTLVLFWLPMAIFYLMDLCHTNRGLRVWRHVGLALSAGGLCLSFLFIFDSFMYGNLTFPPWNFFKWNILFGVGSFYGSNPFHWYLSNASFALCNLAILPMLRCRGGNKSLLLSLMASLALFSLIEHKEHRFVLPLLPIAMIFAGIGLAQWKWRKAFLWVYIPLNITTFLYLSLIHQSGATRLVYPVLREELLPRDSKVLFLMPCHSTPYQSYLQRPDVSLRFLTCEPGTTEEAEIFYAHPLAWLAKNNGQSLSADLIVVFDTLEEPLRAYMEASGYDERHRIFHTHFPSGRIGKEILVYRKNLIFTYNQII